MITAWRIGRIVGAAVMLAGVYGNLVISLDSGNFNPFNFFGYFTIQNSLIGAAALLVALPFTGKERPQWVEYLRVCAAVYLSIVLTVYWTLLAPLDPPSVVQTWQNLTVHLFSGVVVLADWLLEGPRARLPLRRVWIVLLYPLTWLVVVLIRGATDGWFPYPFLDPAKGYGTIMVIVAVIIVSGLAVGSLLYRATRWRILTPA